MGWDIKTIATGEWLELLVLQTLAGPREFVRRTNNKFLAVKVLPLLIREPVGQIDWNKPFPEIIKEIGQENLDVFFLAIDRPITYLPAIPLAANFVIELPGGLIDIGETTREAALREFREEGSPSGSFITYKTHELIPLCCWDNGTNNEWYTVVAMVAEGELRPKPQEGIVPEKCRRVPLTQARKWLLEQSSNNIAVEGFTFNAIDALCSLLNG